MAVALIVPVLLSLCFVIALIIDEYKEIMALSMEVALELRRQLTHHLIFAGVLFLISALMALLLPEFVSPETTLLISGGVLIFALASAITTVIESRLRRRGL